MKLNSQVAARWMQNQAAEKPVLSLRCSLAIIAPIGLLLNLESVHSTASGLLLASFASLVACLNPGAWFFHVAMSQICPDPLASPLTLSQMLMVAWVVTLPFNGCLRLIRLSSPYILHVAPFLVWYSAAAFIARGELLNPMIPAICMGGVSYLYTLQPGISHRSLAVLLVAGAAYSVIGYWGAVLQIPVVLVNTSARIGAGYLERIGGGRRDVNVAAVNIVFFLIGVLAHTLFAGKNTGVIRRLALAAGSLALGGPALLGTVSRQGVYSFVIGLLALAGVGVMSGKHQREIVLRATVTTIASGVMLYCFVPGAITTLVGEPLRRVLARSERIAAQSNESAFVSGRSFLWTVHAAGMLAHPIAGIPKGEVVDFGGYGAARIGEDGSFVEAHNAFLQVGSHSGIPGFCLFIYLFLSIPAVLMRRGIHNKEPYLVLYIVLFTVFMALSMGGWKVYWAFMCIGLRVSERALCRSGYPPVGTRVS